jgi:putative oxidoreductase
VKTRDIILNPGRHCIGTSMGLLLLRVVPGLFVIVAHGMAKFENFQENAEHFPAMFGFSGPIALGGVVFAETVCAGAVVVGLGTRIAVIPLAAALLFETFAIHGNYGVASHELSLVYAAVFLPLMFTGGGRFSADALICRERGYERGPSCDL